MDRVYQGLSLPSAQDPGGSEMFALVNSKQMMKNLNNFVLKNSYSCNGDWKGRTEGAKPKPKKYMKI